MRFIQCFLIGLFSLSCLSGFAGETAQGTLKNGIRYYLYNDPFETEMTVGFVVKRPKQHLFFPVPDPFEVREDRGLFSDQYYYDMGDGYVFFAGGVERSLSDGLVYISECLKRDLFSKEAVQQLRFDYEEDREELEGDDLEDASWEEMLAFLVGDSAAYEDKLFRQTDEQIQNLCHAFFEPSRMAIFVTGSFDLSEIKDQLQLLFEEIQGEGTLVESYHYDRHQRPFAFTIKAYNIADECFEEDTGEYFEHKEEKAQELSWYIYELTPSFRECVLHDLFLLSHYNANSNFCSDSFGELRVDTGIPFLGKVPCEKIDQRTFDQAKKALDARYRNDAAPFFEKCAAHFGLDFPDDLEPANGNLLRELETIELEDLNAFISEKIREVPILRKFNWL